MYPQNVIHIYGIIDREQEVSELAVKNGIGLLGLTRRVMNLENYYMELIKAEHENKGEYSMLNYMKSEYYRIFHSKEVYLLTVIFTALLTTYNLIVYFCRVPPHFQYANTNNPKCCLCCNVFVSDGISFFTWKIIVRRQWNGSNT